MLRKSFSTHLRTRACAAAIPASLLVGWLAASLLIGACQRKAILPTLPYAARIEADNQSLSGMEGARLPIRLTLSNLGQEAWDSESTPPCFLSYHLTDRDRSVTRFDNRRIPLPQRIEPGESVELEVLFRVPFRSGEHILEFDLVREGVAWFKDGGSETLEIQLDVKERLWPDSVQEIRLESGMRTRFTSSRPEINQLYKLIRLTLEENETTFQGRTGMVSGFAPGKDYPQIWLRDAATIIPASRWFYSAEWLSSWLEEHLAYQREDGSLYDWIDSRGEADKNTTETDQEASAIQAAYQVYQILGQDWLREEIAGRTIIARLEAALDFVKRERWDPKLGMIKGAHTADWGDVDIVDAGQDAVYTDENTHWTVDIYDQAMFYQAARELAEMWVAIGGKDKAAAWRGAAAAIQENTTAALWQEDRGFFAVHRHLDDLVHDFDENDIFAMGGNAQAVVSGLADPQQAQRIIETALERQEALEVSTISGTLLPPYPAGTYRHGLLDDPFEYQNGGQWDWFGGRLIRAMYENGFSTQATEKLLEIIQKNIANRGFFEWDNRKGVGRGSDIFCGSAGVLAKAAVEEYFGISLDQDRIRIEPKLGQDIGKIHLYLPARDLFVAYDYSFNQKDHEIRLRINSNYDSKGTVSIWIPSFPIDQPGFGRIKITVNDQSEEYQTERRGNDSYVTFRSSLKQKDVRITLR